MFVINALKESIKALEQSAKDFDHLDNLSDLDALESKTQKIVFNLQMQANQVAGELAPAFMNRRAELQNANAAELLRRIRERQEKVKDNIIKENKDATSIDGDSADTIGNSSIENLSSNKQSTMGSEVVLAQDVVRSVEEQNDESKLPMSEGETADHKDKESKNPDSENSEEKIKDVRDSNRQRKPNSGNSKSKSPKEAK